MSGIERKSAVDLINDFNFALDDFGGPMTFAEFLDVLKKYDEAEGLTAISGSKEGKASAGKRKEDLLFDAREEIRDTYGDEIAGEFDVIIDRLKRNIPSSDDAIKAALEKVKDILPLIDIDGMSFGEAMEKLQRLREGNKTAEGIEGVGIRGDIQVLTMKLRAALKVHEVEEKLIDHIMG